MSQKWFKFVYKHHKKTHPESVRGRKPPNKKCVRIFRDPKSTSSSIKSEYKDERRRRMNLKTVVKETEHPAFQETPHS